MHPKTIVSILFSSIKSLAVLAYEPGSVFKIFTAASFLNSGAVGKNEVFVCNGRHEVRSANGEKAVITCLGTHGPVTVREALI